jgi:hypothetical protein
MNDPKKYSELTRLASVRTAWRDFLQSMQVGSLRWPFVFPILLCFLKGRPFRLKTLPCSEANKRYIFTFKV